MKRVLSGIQPTGSPHIGNYLGALKNWAKIQYDYDSIYCIVDLHAITVYQKPEELRAKIEELAGLLQYPVLMAADILLYQAAIVPVGEDQSQHLELARDIAQRFNSLYGETFVMPATHLPSVGARIMGLDEPDKKMSKSAKGAGHAVWVLEPPAQIRKKIMRATTDSQPAVDFDQLGAGVANLLSIFQAFTEWT